MICSKQYFQWHNIISCISIPQTLWSSHLSFIMHNLQGIQTLLIGCNSITHVYFPSPSMHHKCKKNITQYLSFNALYCSDLIPNVKNIVAKTSLMEWVLLLYVYLSQVLSSFISKVLMYHPVHIDLFKYHHVVSYVYTLYLTHPMHWCRKWDSRHYKSTNVNEWFPHRLHACLSLTPCNRVA